MHTSDLIADYAVLADIPKAEARRRVELLLAQIASALAAGQDVALKGIGTLAPVDRSARAGVGPGGKAYDVPARKSVRLRPASALVEALNAGV